VTEKKKERETPIDGTGVTKNVQEAVMVIERLDRKEMRSNFSRYLLKTLEKFDDFEDT
jgi:hypothetical protein